MDTTPKYIKMCEKAEEIEKPKLPRPGDWFAYKYHRKYSQIACYGHFEEQHMYIGHPIWLPRQDQLQEMLWKNGYEHKFDLHIDLEQWVIDMTGDSYDALQPEKLNLDTLEQLWLAFVMHEKYGKTWDEEKEEWKHGL
jgi:hypothetical protein